MSSNLILETFKKFVVSDNSEDMFVTGRAGTGKTTDLRGTIEWCQEQGIEVVVCAFTHDACNILRSKLPPQTSVMTLHKFIKKRPGINVDATKRDCVTINSRFGVAEKTSVLFVDEYSIVGEKDLMDIRELQDAEEGSIGLRVCWLGDPYQLPPVGDAPAIIPFGRFALTLTKQYRQTKGNPLSATIDQLVSFIEGKVPEPLITSNQFRRDADIASEYLSCKDNKILLAFTNKKVQDLNWTIQGYSEPVPGDTVFSPTTKQTYTFSRFVPAHEVYLLDLPFGEPLRPNSKYKTLEFLITQDYKFAEVEDKDGELYVFACVFGHYEYKVYLEQLKSDAAGSNLAITKGDKKKSAASWAKDNPDSRETRDRAKAWRKFLSFNEAVICLDFAHAKTVHKSQGSTYHTVFLDSKDLGLAAETNYTLYLKLMYVALSRATNNVVTN